MSPPSELPASNAPPPPALTSEAPTPAPTSEAPPTPAPTSEAPPTPAPTSEAPPTPAPTSEAPPTPAPILLTIFTVAGTPTTTEKAAPNTCNIPVISYLLFTCSLSLLPCQLLFMLPSSLPLPCPLLLLLLLCHFLSSSSPLPASSVP
ncbi:hypothetical protein OTU49_002532 [Cherax quadricarinatus]|uniref:Uncharacterized protein n=1 Tax=Cherax quadricarinatus TaxID=27406 RepID=A0AAW0XN67_CHEQU